MSPLSEISARYCDVRAMCEPTATSRHPAGGGRHLERVLGLRVGSSVRKGIVMDSWEKPSWGLPGAREGPGMPWETPRHSTKTCQNASRDAKEGHRNRQLGLTQTNIIYTLKFSLRYSLRYRLRYIKFGTRGKTNVDTQTN